MSLKQSIVIVNEYTIKNKSTKGGSRGGTPGDYVLRYMARKGSVEEVTPIRLRELDDYVIRYMARKEATDTAIDVPEIKVKMKEAQGLGGVSFGVQHGRVDVSFSDEGVRSISKEIQSLFERGHTCLKTVLSFDDDYLRKHKIIDEHFEFQQDGDYRGNLDQMKLRMAIINGVNKMAKEYDDLLWVGTIQIDTKHVHCHLCLVDAGRGTVMDDGTQRGKISKKAKAYLRRGIDTYLDEKQTIKMMSSNVTYDKRNTICHIKRFTHKALEHNGLPQFLIACLPDDKRLWRAGTNNKNMKKANAIVYDYVIEVLSEPDSGYERAQQHIREYASTRAKNEGLTEFEYRRLIKNGEKQVIDDCINGVYSVLKQIPKDEWVVRTPMLAAMSMDYESMAAEKDDDQLLDFGFRLRSYSNRLNHYKKETRRYQLAIHDYENATVVSDDSKPLYDFFKYEVDYNARLMCKYQYFLSFVPMREDYETEFNDLMDYQMKLKDLNRMMNDPSLKRMTPERAEDYGRRVYNQPGGRYALISPDVLTVRYDRMSDTYQKKEVRFKEHLAEYGMCYKDEQVVFEKPYAFDDVKALDLHHLQYDFGEQVHISDINKQRFITNAYERKKLYNGAVDYLRLSDQADLLDLLPGYDVKYMADFASLLEEQSTLPAKKPVSTGKKAGRTITNATNYTNDMALMVRGVVASVQFE